MIPAPLALQLYSIRETLNADYEAGIRAVAALGYAGVETAGFPGTTPAAAGALFRELGLRVCAMHSPMPLGDKQAEVLEAAAAVGASRLVMAWKPPELFASLDNIRRVCDELNEADAVCRGHALAVGYHNHDQEFQMVDGRPALLHMLDYLTPSVFFEVDTYWAKVAGFDPAEIIRTLGSRAPLLHIKDGPAKKDAPMTAVGDGVMDLASIVNAGREHAEWLIVEIDRCATDMMTAVDQSYYYLRAKGWGHGRG
jgi:sugar phosphate isomerase/epimerase